MKNPIRIDIVWDKLTGEKLWNHKECGGTLRIGEGDDGINYFVCSFCRESSTRISGELLQDNAFDNLQTEGTVLH